MFAPSGNVDHLQIGQRNLSVCHKLLAQYAIAIVAQEVGGTVGRTVMLDCQSGQLLVRTAIPRAEFTI